MTIYRLALILICLSPCAAQHSPADTGAPEVSVTHAAGKWTTAGRKNTVELDQSSLAITAHAGPAVWKTMPSAARDMLVASQGNELPVRLADAGQIQIAPYQTGFKTGVKIVLDKFRAADVRVVLTMCLEGADEDLVFDTIANERAAAVKELNWPPAMDGRDVDYTVISSDNGTLLPRDWPAPYHPIQRAANEHSVIQSHLIESWSMSWWGFLKGPSA